MIIVDSEDRPVMIEYPYGNGVVIASLTTTEFRYDGCPQRTERKLLANEIAYQVNFCDTCECTERDIPFTATIETGVPFPVVDVGTPVFNGNLTDNVECTTDTCLQTVTFTVCDTTLECCITVGTINFSGTADLLITVPATLETDCGMQEVGLNGAVTVPIDQTCFTCEDEQVCPDTICRLLETVQDTFTATIISDTQIQVSGTVRFNCP
ncbi:hypothetical protein J7E38_14490 [Bacillus sp. ISL-35]|uniref:hypothetical protein n=1 Tax=Bacillus sp. ISL-35 TaxID=2819122 RepID=UPI001BE9EDB3|nr:hypothetical protein [Bacillus sp. ISL-35]MBT2680218.1 hypothetical protein [Bacillus sp. ISL-35]MBT2704494.1 hypothetical protein [Chryseobacterium sp. ISL-80]